MRLFSLASTVLALAVGMAVMVPPADAYSRRGAREGMGYVTAESRYGPQVITAPVRLSAQGRREVRLPGGTWIECRRSCSETLRIETIDFWAVRDRGPGGFTDDVGYLRFRF